METLLEIHGILSLLFIKLRFSGAIWYEGESDYQNPAQYACTFPTLIQGWRDRVDLPHVPLGFVQLAADEKWDFSLVWISQNEALRLNKVFMATAIDLDDPTSPYDPIHPRSKQEVARKLALGLENEMYGLSQVSQGPGPVSANVVKNTFGTIWNWTSFSKMLMDCMKTEPVSVKTRKPN